MAAPCACSGRAADRPADERRAGPRRPAPACTAYHGLLGYRSWHARQSTTCYDPAFQAGYLKTPIFDAGSRPAELFYLIGGPSAGSYKVGLAICCLLAPLAFAVAGRGAGLGAGGACLAAVIGGTLWWSPPCRVAAEAGDLDLLVGGMCAPVTSLAGPVRAVRRGRSSGSSLAGQRRGRLVHAPARHGRGRRAVAAVPPVGVSRRAVRVDFGLITANLVGLGVNGFWLWDWAAHLWMYVPYGGEDAPASLWPAAMQEWEAFLPHDPVDLAACAIGIVGLIGSPAGTAGRPGSSVPGQSCTLPAAGRGVCGRCWPRSARRSC